MVKTLTKRHLLRNLDSFFDQLNGKALSYNNLLDVDAAVHLISEFKDTTFAILKHNNACGIASRNILKQAYLDALAAGQYQLLAGYSYTIQNLI